MYGVKDKCLIRDKNEMEEIFLQDFGKKSEEILHKIEPEPVAAASIAQVLEMIILHTYIHTHTRARVCIMQNKSGREKNILKINSSELL